LDDVGNCHADVMSKNVVYRAAVGTN
jgi:hypothetical protein